MCAAIVERDSERLLAAAGNGALPGVPATAIAVAARAAADLDGADLHAARGEHLAEVEDLMVTSAAHFHILRQVDVPDGEPVLVYVRLRRGRANPATCRRELGSAQLREAVVRACGGADQPDRTPRPLPAGRLSSPPRPLRLASGPANPAPITTAPVNPPPPRDPRTAITNSAPPDRAGPATISPLPAPRRPIAPSTSLRPAMASIGMSASDSHIGTGEGDKAGPQARGSAPAATPVAATQRSLPPPSPPPLLPTPPTRSAGSGRSLGSLAAAAMPAAPVHRGAPVNPPAPSPRPPTPDLRDRVPAAPPDEPGRHDRSRADDGVFPLPRRVRGAHLVGAPTTAEAARDPGGDDAAAAATPSVLRQGWMHDPTTLRRLLSGLRRLG